VLLLYTIKRRLTSWRHAVALPVVLSARSALWLQQSRSEQSGGRVVNLFFSLLCTIPLRLNFMCRCTNSSCLHRLWRWNRECSETSTQNSDSRESARRQITTFRTRAKILYQRSLIFFLFIFLVYSSCFFISVRFSFFLTFRLSLCGFFSLLSCLLPFCSLLLLFFKLPRILDFRLHSKLFFRTKW